MRAIWAICTKKWEKVLKNWEKKFKNMITARLNTEYDLFQCTKKEIPGDKEEIPILDQGLLFIDANVLYTWHDTMCLEPLSGPILK